MNKKAFTLTELIGVITILGIIAIIAFPPLLKQIKGTQSKIDEATQKLIIAGASNYVDENKNDFPKVTGKTYCIALQTLVDDNKLSKDLADSEGNKLDLNKYVKVEAKKNSYNYTITDECDIYYKDLVLNGADPILKTGMIPVNIDSDGTVKKADVMQSWYNYTDKKWANAIVLDDNYASLVGNSKVNGAVKNDGYVSFDGVDDHINLGLENHDFGQNVTCAIRLKVNTPSTDANLINNYEWAGLGLFLRDGTKFNFGIMLEGNDNYTIIKDSLDFDLGRWYTVVGTYDGNTMNLYVDGKLHATANVSGAILESSLPFRVAANYDVDSNIYHEHSNIDVSNVDIYSRTLTAEEIKNGYSDKVKIQNNDNLLRHVDFSNKVYENGEIIPEDSISQYYTWIPRYKYKLWYTEAIDGVNDELDPTKVHSIKIVFENKNTKKSNGITNGEYLTHPAFTFGDEELNGIWVGKFETGYNGATTKAEAKVSVTNPAKVIIKPNAYAWGQISVSNMFATALGMNDDNNVFGLNSESDTHMMKNIEWGAVSYLAYSKYGKDSEVYVNDNLDLITGCGNDTPKGDGTIECKNKYGTSLDNLYNQSTTGNISGIFDMSGGSWEYVMGYMTGALTKYGESGFTDATFPSENKYIDMYVSNNTLDSIDSRLYTIRKLGDATGELGPFVNFRDKHESGEELIHAKSSWFGNYSITIKKGAPWQARGGMAGGGVAEGLLAFTTLNGRDYTNVSFHVVIS